MRQSSALLLLCLFAGLQICYSVTPGSYIACVSFGTACDGCLPSTSSFEEGTVADAGKCRVADCDTAATSADWCASCAPGEAQYTNYNASKCTTYDCGAGSPTYSDAFCADCNATNVYVNKGATKCQDTNCGVSLTSGITDKYCANCDEVNVYASKSGKQCGSNDCKTPLVENLTDAYCAQCDESNYYANTAKTACVSQACTGVTFTDASCAICSPSTPTYSKDGENICVDCTVAVKTDAVCAQCDTVANKATYDGKKCKASKCDVDQAVSATFCTNCGELKFFDSVKVACVASDCSATIEAGKYTDAWCADCKAGSTKAAADFNSCYVEEAVVTSSYILSASFIALAIINLF